MNQRISSIALGIALVCTASSVHGMSKSREKADQLLADMRSGTLSYSWKKTPNEKTTPIGLMIYNSQQNTMGVTIKNKTLGADYYLFRVMSGEAFMVELDVNSNTEIITYNLEQNSAWDYKRSSAISAAMIKAQEKNKTNELGGYIKPRYLKCTPGKILYAEYVTTSYGPELRPFTDLANNISYKELYNREDPRGKNKPTNEPSPFIAKPVNAINDDDL